MGGCFTTLSSLWPRPLSRLERIEEVTQWDLSRFPKTVRHPQLHQLTWACELTNVSGWVFTAEWPQDLPDGAAIPEAHEELLQAVEKIAKDKGLHLDFICPSFAGANQNVLRGFGQKNLEDLKTVSAKYDKEGFFQKQQSGGFLLRNA